MTPERIPESRPYIALLNQSIMSNRELMVQVEKILADWKFDSTHYLMSLQGPAILLSMKGQEKIKDEQREIIEKMGMVILG